jgi:predicted lipid-binding transport protein (Tim44 family)
MKLLLTAIIGLFSLALVIPDAEARRMGGGRNLGMQRSAPAQPPQKAGPAQQQQQQQQAAPATPAQQPAGASRWLAPLAGFALGAGLAALFLNNGWAGFLAGILLLGLIAAALYYLVRALRGRVEQRPLQYAGTAQQGPVLTSLSGGAGAQSVAATSERWPADFDVAEFVRHARLNFVRLQQAHERGDLAALRDFLSPELYGEIEAEIRTAGDAPRHTEVVTLQAEVLDVARESGSYVVSVRFSGLIREDEGAEPAEFSEIWHLEKPVTGRSGWLVAGIQQS